MTTPEMREMIFRGLRAFLSSLSEKERKIIFMREGVYGEFYTLAEAAKEIGVTRERIRQIEAKANEKIRLFLNDYEDIHSPLVKRLTEK